MTTFTYKEPFVDYRQILNSVDQLMVWSDILGTYCRLQEPVCNTLRMDRHPNCWLDFGITKYQYIVMNDFADSRFHGMTMFDALMFKHNISFYQACEYIYNVHILGSGFTLTNTPQFNLPKKSSKLPFHISFIPYNGFIKRDRLHFEPLGISSDNLREDNVYSVWKYRTSKGKGILEFPTPTNTYAYTLPSQHVKLHMPYESKRFITNADSYDLGMYDKLPETGDVLFICKSYNDARIQKNLGFPNVIWIQGEHFKIPDEIISDLYERFNVIYIYYDNDAAGRKGATSLTEYCNTLTDSDKFKAIWLRESLLEYEYTHYLSGKFRKGITDNADYVPLFGEKQLKKEIKMLL